MGLKGRVCSYLKKGRGKKGIKVVGFTVLVISSGACETNSLQGSGGGGCGCAPRPLCSQHWAGELLWPAGNPWEPVPSAAKPILTLRAAKVLLQPWVHSWEAASWGSFSLPYLPSVLLLFTLKVNRFISFILQLGASNTGHSMCQTGKC